MDELSMGNGHLAEGWCTSPSSWLDVMRGACKTLCRAPSKDIRSISVTVRIEEAPGVSRSALQLVRYIAEEYGLVGTAQFDNLFLTARFSRPDGRSVNRGGFR